MVSEQKAAGVPAGHKVSVAAAEADFIESSKVVSLGRPAGSELHALA